MSTELRYISLYTFSLVITVLTLVASINKLQPLLFQQIFTSCTAVYQSITANSVVISTVFATGLLLLFVSLSLKIILSSYRTSQSLADISSNAQKHFPRALQKIASRLHIPRNQFIITNHAKPLAVTAGLLQPKVVFSRSLINQLTEKELEAVVLHEVYHQQHKHGLLYVMAEAIAASLIAITPILKDIIKKMKEDFETVADQHAAEYQGTTTHVSTALAKLSGKAFITSLPSFTSITNARLRHLDERKSYLSSLSKKKLFFSLIMIMALSFFAVMPVDTAQSVSYTDQSSTCQAGQNCANVCVSKHSVGMSKQQNSSSILPASVF